MVAVVLPVEARQVLAGLVTTVAAAAGQATDARSRADVGLTLPVATAAAVAATTTDGPPAVGVVEAPTTLTEPTRVDPVELPLPPTEAAPLLVAAIRGASNVPMALVPAVPAPVRSANAVETIPAVILAVPAAKVPAALVVALPLPVPAILVTIGAPLEAPGEARRPSAHVAAEAAEPTRRQRRVGRPRAVAGPAGLGAPRATPAAEVVRLARLVAAVGFQGALEVGPRTAL